MTTKRASSAAAARITTATRHLFHGSLSGLALIYAWHYWPFSSLLAIYQQY